MGIEPDLPPQEIELDLFLDHPKCVDELRSRLSSVSWFMKDLKEPIARRANREDDCPGHFWQSRFRCEPLLDDEAILTCATYVDMNPVAAGVTDDALGARFTSVAEHLRRLVLDTAEGDLPQGREPTDEDREALLKLLDEVEFSPAIPCRPEPYLVEDKTPAAADDAVPKGAEAPPATPTTTLPLPHRAVLSMTLGGYLRRLAAASGFTVAKRSAMSPPPGRRGDPADGATGVGKLAQAILDGVDRSMESLARLLLESRFWGTAIGSTQSLATEAARRGRHRVSCAIR